MQGHEKYVLKNKKNIELYNKFTEWLTKLKHRERGIEFYTTIVKKFAWFLENKKGKTLSEFTNFDIIDFLDYEEKNGINSSTIVSEKIVLRKLIYFLSSYYGGEWLLRAHEVKIGNVAELKLDTSLVTLNTEAKSLNDGEIIKLLSIFEDDPITYSGTVLTLYFGWRQHEATISLYNALKGKDKCFVDFKECKIKIETAKRKDVYRYRMLPYPEELNEYMKIWCKFIEDYAKNRKSGTKYMWQVLQKRYNYRSSEIESILGFKVTPKFGRYTVETRFKEDGISQIYIDYWLGHKTGITFIELPDGTVIPRRYARTERAYTDINEMCETLRKMMIDEEKHFFVRLIRKYK